MNVLVFVNMKLNQYGDSIHIIFIKSDPNRACCSKCAHDLNLRIGEQDG